MSHLIGNLPQLEALEVLVKHSRKVCSQLKRDGQKHTIRLHMLNDALEAFDDRHRRLIERLLELTHGLEDMRRSQGNHKGSQKNSHIHVLWGQRFRRRAMAEGAEHVDAL